MIKRDNLAVLEGCSPVLFPPVEKGNILELRQEIYDEFSEIEPDVRKNSDYAMLKFIMISPERLRNPMMQKLQNSDGEPLMFHQLIYGIDSP